MPTSKKLFRILSLDGGGSWALIQARALQKLFGEQARGHHILSRFDLVAANSAGSLVLGGLLKDMALDEIVFLFKDQAMREKLFSRLGLDHLLDKILQLTLKLGPKYSSARKLEGLRGILDEIADTPLDQLSLGARAAPHLLICGFDYDRKRASFFRSDRASLADGPPGKAAPTLVHAIHASTNAPVNYFDLPAQFSDDLHIADRRFWDGAIGGYNNPVLAAVVEALANRERYRCTPHSIRVLSIGTGSVNLPMPGIHPAQSAVLEAVCSVPRLHKDLDKLARSIISDPPDAASYTAHLMLGGAVSVSPEAPVEDSPLVRLNPMIQPVLSEHEKPAWHLPKGLTSLQFQQLVHLDIDAVEQGEVKLIERFCNAWLADHVPNQTIRHDADFQPLIGHNRFSAAKAAWERQAGLTEPPLLRFAAQ